MSERTDTSTDRSGRANGQGGRALVVANERVAGSELREALVERLGDGIGEVFVVAPALTDSGLKFALGDVDDAIEPARERMEKTVAELREAGIPAAGEVGDADPIQAISDEIEKFHPDQVLIVGHRDEDGAFAEKGLLEQVERDVELPVIELVVDSASSPHVLEVEETESGVGRGEGWRPSGNWPPLTGRDIAGILIAIVGTLVLGMLAAADPSAGRILIAMFVALVNLAHVVGLFLFQSVGYEGLWNRFFSRLSLVGTIGALIVSLALGPLT